MPRSIPLQNFEGKHRRYISQSEANGLLETGKATKFCRRCGRSSERGRCLGGGEHQTVYRLREPERRERHSPCTITARESDAVMGIGSPSFVDASREKFEAWPFVGDTKAVRVPPRVAQ